jgi:hypothetical protein
VEESIDDVRLMILERLGVKPEPGRGDPQASALNGQVAEWEEEWMEEVQKLLEMDAGWNWLVFFKTIRNNMIVSLTPLTVP